MGSFARPPSLVCFLRDSIEQSTRWAVFEPNDQHLWAALRQAVTAFLTDQWRHGALMGTTPDQAFYVQCDSSTNPEERVNEGTVTCRIGIAPIRPAEFIPFTVTQTAGQASAGE
ncbi:phage tail sheath C-terminal domain-containing protein [Streptomyces sp. S186]|uniref:phage tail sheath C-terminal domain-containing protein n=1 Tax=Streptomyces sp. S186 TaxID=3434395 RepID=UPI003F681069